MDRKKALADSWDKNSGNWTKAVRAGLIPSRKAGTDDAIVNAIVSRKPSRILDVGCGEGWLIRLVRELTNCAAVGIDGSKQLVEDARQADPHSEYRVTTYIDLIQGSHPVGRDFDVIVFNYSLFDEDSARLIEAVGPLLARDGVVIIQTLHPWSLPPGEPYSDGWRTENFATFENQNWEPMPWYFRTMQSWHDVIRNAGMALIDLQEPSAEPGGRPLSLIMICAREVSNR
jgi:SAM-dependent methyltransferase